MNKDPARLNVGSRRKFNQPNLKSKMIIIKSKTTTRLTQHVIFITMFWVIRPAIFRFRCYRIMKLADGQNTDPQSMDSPNGLPLTVVF